jgi:hypothetical protein
MRRTVAAALAAGVWSLAPAARAVRVTPIDNLPCPLDPAVSVRGFRKVLDNSVGGWDADLAYYGKEGQWRTFHVATCPGNLFSVYQEHLSEPLDARQKKLVEAALVKARAKLKDPANPTVTERHVLAAAVYEALGMPPLFLADVWLEASWTARDRAVGETTLLEGPAFTRRLLEAGAGELAKPLTPAQQRTVRFNLARVAHRGGYGAERDAHLAAFAALGPLSAQEQKALDIVRAVAQVEEPPLQREALRRYREALAKGGLSPKETARALYLSAELQRRLGALAEARAGFTRALAAPGLDPMHAEMARALLAELEGRPVGAPPGPQ